MRILIAASILLAVLAVEARAETDTQSGNYWSGLCSSNSSYDQGACIGFVIGLTGLGDEAFDFDGEKVFKKMGICIPTGATNGQARDIFVQYMARNPGERHQPAPKLLVRALQETYPCPKQ